MGPAGFLGLGLDLDRCEDRQTLEQLVLGGLGEVSKIHVLHHEAHALDEVQGFADGAYSNVFPTLIDAQQCDGALNGPFTCPGNVTQPLNSTDSNPNSPNAGTTYVYYSFFCNLNPGTCSDGSATIPSFGSALRTGQT